MPNRFVLLALLLLAAATASASMPVKKTLTGCVVDKVFYSVGGGVYRVKTPATLDLGPFEGKEVAMDGWLSPGDRFRLEKGANPEVKQAVCPAASQRLIKIGKVVRLRVEATKAATAGEFDRAGELIGQAMALVSPVYCDTFTDRAYVMALKGDLGAAGNDLATIKAKNCHVDGRMNPLLLQDVGNALHEKGDKRGAIMALQLALAACDTDRCQSAIAKDLQAVKK